MLIFFLLFELCFAQTNDVNLSEKINRLIELNHSAIGSGDDFFATDNVELELVDDLLLEKEKLSDDLIHQLYVKKIGIYERTKNKNELINLLEEYTNSYSNHSAQFMLCVETQIRDKFQPVDCYQKSSKLITEYMENIKKEGNEEYFLMFEFSKILSDYLGKLPTENACNLVKRANSFKNEKILLLTYFGSLDLAKKRGLLNDKDLNNLCYSEEYMNDYR